MSDVPSAVGCGSGSLSVDEPFSNDRDRQIFAFSLFRFIALSLYRFSLYRYWLCRWTLGSVLLFLTWVSQIMTIQWSDPNVAEPYRVIVILNK